MLYVGQGATSFIACASGPRFSALPFSRSCPLRGPRAAAGRKRRAPSAPRTRRANTLDFGERARPLPAARGVTARVRAPGANRSGRAGRRCAQPFGVPGHPAHRGDPRRRHRGDARRGDGPRGEGIGARRPHARIASRSIHHRARGGRLGDGSFGAQRDRAGRGHGRVAQVHGRLASGVERGVSRGARPRISRRRRRGAHGRAAWLARRPASRLVLPRLQFVPGAARAPLHRGRRTA